MAVGGPLSPTHGLYFGLHRLASKTILETKVT